VPHALDAHHAVTTCQPCARRAPDGMGRPKAGIWAARAGLRSSEPLWPWATVGLEGIVMFFNFSMDLFKCKSNSIQFELDFLQICSNRVFEWISFKSLDSNMRI
jgi:hypothetical protein